MSSSLNIVTVIVSEGGGGILYLEYLDGHKEVFKPEYSLDNSRLALHTFYESKSKKNIPIKNSFNLGMIDYFPSCVSLLYWNYFYNYFRYEKFIKYIYENKIKIIKIRNNGYGNLKFILERLNLHKEKRSFFSNSRIIRRLKVLLWDVLVLRNRLIVRAGEKTILFVRENFNDFRSKDLIIDLKKNYDVVEASWPKKYEILTKFFSKNYFFCCPGKNKKLFDTHLIDSGNKLEDKALQYVNNIINLRIATEDHFTRSLGNKKFKFMIGLDDCNYIYPIIYGCRKSGITTIGIQHSTYCFEHEAYIMSHLNSHLWFDNLLVYGDYWRNKFIEHNKVFKSENILVSKNKINFLDYTLKVNTDKTEGLNILLIYEFLADTIEIGKYIDKLMKLGYNIYFKVRLDEDINEQIKSYGLSENITSKWIIVRNVDRELMNKINVVAGTYSTMLFDLYPYGKPIVIFKTKFIFNSDTLPDISKCCELSDVDRFSDFTIPHSQEKVANLSKKLFGDEPLNIVLSRIN